MTTHDPAPFGLVEWTEGSHEFSAPCSSEQCISIKEQTGRGKAFFTDKITNRSYCKRCGQKLRYHRKKATERGEDMPVTFTDVAERLNNIRRH